MGRGAIIKLCAVGVETSAPDLDYFPLHELLPDLWLAQRTLGKALNRTAFWRRSRTLCPFFISAYYPSALTRLSLTTEGTGARLGRRMENSKNRQELETKPDSDLAALHRLRSWG